MTIEAGGQQIGEVTSGTYSASLSRGIGMAYASSEHSKVGSELDVNTGRAKIGARVVRRPFYDGAFHSRKRVSKTSEANK